jgi:2,4-dienoyl-CoA reductase-like NADH-dependent reductase (Old Yellow Enzyme family)
MSPTDSGLFSPLAIAGVRLRNRVVISPMCTYSCAGDGIATDWHLVHLGQFALGGAAVVCVEATAVAPGGRITYGDMGIWSSAHASALGRVAAFIKAHGALPALQIAHAGRKASMQRPWETNAPIFAQTLRPGEPPWQTVAPSALAAKEGWPVPAELSVDDIQSLRRSFVTAAQRALDAGFEILEVHAAHGYLLHSFLSPVSNRRTDGYGGGLEGRMRFVLEVVADVRRVWPESKPLFVRISSVDADGSPEGWQLADSIVLAKALRQRGVDVVDCSSGGLSGLATAAIGVQPLGFRIPYAKAIRQATDMLTMTVGLVLKPDQADAAVRSGSADLVGIGREALYDPFWALHAARELGVDPDFQGWPEPYGWWLVRRQALLRRIRQA